MQLARCREHTPNWLLKQEQVLISTIVDNNSMIDILPWKHGHTDIGGCDRDLHGREGIRGAYHFPGRASGRLASKPPMSSAMPEAMVRHAETRRIGRDRHGLAVHRQDANATESSTPGRPSSAIGLSISMLLATGCAGTPAETGLDVGGDHGCVLAVPWMGSWFLNICHPKSSLSCVLSVDNCSRFLLLYPRSYSFRTLFLKLSISPLHLEWAHQLVSVAKSSRLIVRP